MADPLTEEARRLPCNQTGRPVGWPCGGDLPCCKQDHPGFAMLTREQFDSLTAELATERRERERLRECIRELIGEPLPGENANDRFEAIATEFFRATGFLRPGKSEPLGMGHSDAHDVERQGTWDRWIAARNSRIVNEARNLLAPKGDPDCPVNGDHFLCRTRDERERDAEEGRRNYAENLALEEDIEESMDDDGSGEPDEDECPYCGCTDSLNRCGGDQCVCAYCNGKP